MTGLSLVHYTTNGIHAHGYPRVNVRIPEYKGWHNGKMGSTYK